VAFATSATWLIRHCPRPSDHSNDAGRSPAAARALGAANRLQVVNCCLPAIDRRDKQADGRTPDRYIDAASISKFNEAFQRSDRDHGQTDCDSICRVTDTQCRTCNRGLHNARKTRTHRFIEQPTETQPQNDKRTKVTTCSNQQYLLGLLTLRTVFNTYLKCCSARISLQVLQCAIKFQFFLCKLHDDFSTVT